MVNQLPMQVSLIEREREIKGLLKDAEVLRALGARPAQPARPRRWLAMASDLLDRLTRHANPRAIGARGARCRTELGSSAIA